MSKSAKGKQSKWKRGVTTPKPSTLNFIKVLDKQYERTCSLLNRLHIDLNCQLQHIPLSQITKIYGVRDIGELTKKQANEVLRALREGKVEKNEVSRETNQKS